MKTKARKKILLLAELAKKVKLLRRKGKVVVLSHGVFDLIHPGVIRHLDAAKEEGDVLVATVIKDKDVRKGLGRPIFPDVLRAQNVASLSQVDYVCIVSDEKPFECVRMIKPDIFARDRSIKDCTDNINNKILHEEKKFCLGGVKIHETEGLAFSSSQLINNFLNIYPDEVKSFLSDFSRKYSFEEIAARLDDLKGLKVLLIGDGIIDEYYYCEPIGKAAKAPLVVNKYLSHEVFAGGMFAIANHISGLCQDVKLISLLGSSSTREEFIRASLRPNVKVKFFYREDGSTIVKKRYVSQYLNQKLFEVNYLNDSYINGGLESQVVDYLKDVIPKVDLVLVSDFGHGFITNGMINTIQKLAKRLAVNTQTNAANAGYNLITKYHGPAYACLDEPELRWAMQERFVDIEGVAKKAINAVDAGCLIVTLGKKGSLGINRSNQVNRTPVFSSKVIDTVGAGDAFFAFTSPCVMSGFPLDLVSFIGNAVGALAVQIVCNKKPVEKFELLNFTQALLK